LPFSGDRGTEAAYWFLGILFFLIYLYALRQLVVFIFYNTAKGPRLILFLWKWALLFPVVPLEGNEE
jgi:hypothetical protein